MYPFNTIPRPALAYNNNDPRHAPSSLGPFPRDIAHKILQTLPLHDAASFRNASMINLYSYFECGEARAEHGARLATERMGASTNMQHMYFNLFSVLDLLKDNARDATPASRARILARLIDEIQRCGLCAMDISYLSDLVADSLIAATAELPVAERCGMRWRLVNPLQGDITFGYKHQFYKFIKAAINWSGDLPVEERELFNLVHKVNGFWLRRDSDESNMTPTEAVDLISFITFLPHDREVALLTRIADKIENNRNHGETSEAVRLELLSACEQWPLCERLTIEGKISRPLNYPHADVQWNEPQRDDVCKMESMLNEYLWLPADQKPAVLVQLIHLLRKRAGPSYFTFLPATSPWALASTMVVEAAKLKSVHSSAAVMSELNGLMRYFNLDSCEETAYLFRQAFSAADEHEARTRSRQLLCLNPRPQLYSLLCAEDSTIHPKTKLAASLLRRIEMLRPRDAEVPKDIRKAKFAEECIAVWEDARALGSRRCADIRLKLLERLNEFPRAYMLPAYETFLRDGHTLSTGMKVKLCLIFAGIPAGSDSTGTSIRALIDAVVDLTLSLPRHEMQGTLTKVMQARCMMHMLGKNRLETLTSIFDKLIALPSAVIAPVLIEQAYHQIWHDLPDERQAALSLFYKVLQKGAGFEAEHKGPLLAALAIWFDFSESTDLENACNALMSEVETLPEASRSAWRLYLRIAIRDRQPAKQDSKVIDQLVKALHEECKALGEPLDTFLSVMVLDRFRPGHRRWSANY